MKIKKLYYIFRNTGLKNLILNKPIYIFHHIPKCGGTSVRQALAKWFIMIHDYRPVDDKTYIANRVNIKRIKSYNCLTGHYGTPQTHIYTRYPEFKDENKYRIFSFIREPLSLKISLYYYEKEKQIINKNIKLSQHILERDNYIASILNCNHSNYKAIIDSYYFIGIFERLQVSFNVFSKMTSKPALLVDRKNVSTKDAQKDTLPNDIISRFKKQNKLDYLIYKYCVQKYKDQKQKLNL